MGYLGDQDPQLDARAIASCGNHCVDARIPSPNPNKKKAYWASGYNRLIIADQADKMDFSTEVTSHLYSGTLVLPVFCAHPLSDGTNVFFAGGTSVTQVETVVTKIPLATDTSFQTDSLVVGRFSGSSVTNQVVAFLIGGATTGGTAINAETMAYAVGVWSALSDTLQTGKTAGDANDRHDSGETSSLTLGYLLGGHNTSGVDDLLDIVTFSTATSAASATVSSVGRELMGGMGNEDKGIFTAGSISGTDPTTLVERLTYATEVMAVITSMALGTSDSGATGTSDNGYHIGGYVPGDGLVGLVTAQRVDYATETPVLLPSGDLQGGARFSVRAAGSSYF